MALVVEDPANTPLMQPSAVEYAKQLLNDPCFHQWTTYDSPTDGNPLRVSFSTTSNFDHQEADDMPAILYLGPLMGSRLLLCMVNALACAKKVRVIFIERPGIGTSTPVPIQQRLSHVLTAVETVLTHLRLKNIFLISGSAGTIFSLNLLVTPALRAFLHPRHPYVAALVPWVHPEFSRTRLLSTAARLPETVIGSLGSVLKVVGTSIMPSFGWSAGLLATLVATNSRTETDIENDEHTTQYGMDKKQYRELNQLLVRRVCAEDTSGVGQDAILLLQKNLPAASWSAASSYPAFVSNLRNQEANRLKAESASVTDQSPSRLRFRTFFATSDAMIGDVGREYFDTCFKTCEGLDESVHYTSSVVEMSDHDSVLDIRSGVFGLIFDDINALLLKDRRSGIANISESDQAIAV